MGASGIYKIQSNIKPEKVYVGSSVDLQKRKREHLHALRHNQHFSAKLQCHYNKYGEGDLEFSTLCYCDIPDLIEMEQFCLDALNPVFNTRVLAESRLGIKHTEEAKKKMRDSQLRLHRIPWNKGKTNVYSEETRKRISQSLTGIRQSQETRDKKSRSFKGRVPWNKGLPTELNPRTGTKLGPEALKNITNANRKIAEKRKLANRKSKINESIHIK